MRSLRLEEAISAEWIRSTRLRSPVERFLHNGRVALVVGACLAPVLIGPGAAVAHDHDPPKVVLHVAGGLQQGDPYGTHWKDRKGRSCSVLSIDDVMRFGPPIHARPGTVRGRIVLRKAHRPQDLDLVFWRELDEYGMPATAPEELAVRLAPKRRQGETVAYQARFEVILEDHVYLRLYAEWRDREGCGGYQSAYWTFHIAAPD